MSYLYPTPNEWQRLEAPLLTIDPILECFANNYGMALFKTGQEHPERSLHWGGNPGFLIQLYLENETEPSWNLWRCCFEDREGSHFWRNDFPVRSEQLHSFRERLPVLLDDSLIELQAWAADPDKLELTTSLGPIPTF